ncbi:DUF1906 domain-containing protein [Hazenella sp. IB182353]|uniref:glycoside hydrolase domain-containing protein n=1 Tax=Polycladospora coralii TaxID=2771432 RepID=UPI001746F9AC|nr:glycoside hydrolase domain-containing protein [Polycladospora coralii]MBS7531814.1 DUF1906 domain-containing protein [Polycladospora coralii]
MDQMVLQAQQWVNSEYSGRSGFTIAPEDGRTGWSTMFSLTTALQLELGITKTAHSFGSGTLAALERLGDISMSSNTNSNIVKIIQCGLYCKGYQPYGITGVFDLNTAEAIRDIKENIGLYTPDGVVTPKLFKALLNMDSYVQLAGGSGSVRNIQQWLNRNYNHRKNFYFIPCDGLFSRDIQKALVYAIQYEEGLSDSVANGRFGPTTQRLLPTLSIGNDNKFVSLFQAAMIFNNYAVPFDGVFSQLLSDKVKEFQEFVTLPTTGIGDFQTWASLLVSTGDPHRTTTACDTIREITSERAKVLKQKGYETVGRYLVNASHTNENVHDKKIQVGELQTIFKEGLSMFPIYQTYGGEANYFNYQQGLEDGSAAASAAEGYGFKSGTTIYFAVDFDALGSDITNNIIPHFRGIAEGISPNYNIGVYGSRNVCIQVSEAGLAEKSFVSGMSTGFSGNLGYPLPRNWIYDQIRETGPGEDGLNFGLDHVIKRYDDSVRSVVEPIPHSLWVSNINSAIEGLEVKKGQVWYFWEKGNNNATFRTWDFKNSTWTTQVLWLASDGTYTQYMDDTFKLYPIKNWEEIILRSPTKFYLNKGYISKEQYRTLPAGTALTLDLNTGFISDVDDDSIQFVSIRGYKNNEFDGERISGWIHLPTHRVEPSSYVIDTPFN